MKNTQVALLRGVNVGGNKMVPMAELRHLVEELGGTGVRTLLNSGNVVFSCLKVTPAQTAERLEKALAEAMGVSARVFVLTGKELADVAAANPLKEIADNPSRLMVGFLAAAEDRKKLAEIAKQDWGVERIALTPDGAGAKSSVRAVYMWMPSGIIESKLNKAVSKALKDGVTTRNWATVLKLRAMVEETPAAR